MTDAFAQATPLGRRMQPGRCWTSGAAGAAESVSHTPLGGAKVLTRIDHVMICVPDLERGIDAYARIGFNIYPGGAQAGRATHNAIAFLRDLDEEHSA